jgi:hypothetical protein
MKTVINCLEAKGLPLKNIKKHTHTHTHTHTHPHTHTALNEKKVLFFDSNGIILPKWVPLKQGVIGECFAKTALWNAIWGSEEVRDQCF